MITLFSIPKPFHGLMGIIQRNAIKSWSLLEPKCEIILFGDEKGTTDVAKELGANSIPDIARNDYGTPVVNDMFEKARLHASNDVLCYVNADIILMNDLVRAARRVARCGPYLMVGQRWNLDLDCPIDFKKGWDEDLKKMVRENGRLFTKSGMDYFLFPKGLFREIPPFAIGRPSWDNWMIYHAQSMGYRVIDATKVIMPVHQNHDYSHVPQRKGNTYWGPEAELNQAMAGGSSHVFNLYHADYMLDRAILRPAFENRALLSLMSFKRKLLKWPQNIKVLMDNGKKFH